MTNNSIVYQYIVIVPVIFQYDWGILRQIGVNDFSLIPTWVIIIILDSYPCNIAIILGCHHFPYILSVISPTCLAKNVGEKNGPPCRDAARSSGGHRRRRPGDFLRGTAVELRKGGLAQWENMGKPSKVMKDSGGNRKIPRGKIMDIFFNVPLLWLPEGCVRKPSTRLLQRMAAERNMGGIIADTSSLHCSGDSCRWLQIFRRLQLFCEECILQRFCRDFVGIYYIHLIIHIVGVLRVLPWEGPTCAKTWRHSVFASRPGMLESGRENPRECWNGDPWRFIHIE